MSHKHPLACPPFPLLILVSLLVAHAKSSIVALNPGPGDVVKAGGNCSFGWTPDQTGTWNNMTIDLMSGSNLNMTLVVPVAHGVDGTTQSTYNWTCPFVTPNSNIYFYQAYPYADKESSAWTARFTIASPSGTITTPEYNQQPGGAHIPWGNGHVIEPKPSAEEHAVSTVNSTHTPVTKHKTRQEKTHTTRAHTGTSTITQDKRDGGVPSSQTTTVPQGAYELPAGAYLPKIYTQSPASPRPTGKSAGSVSRGNRQSAVPSLQLFCALSVMWFLI